MSYFEHMDIIPGLLSNSSPIRVQASRLLLIEIEGRKAEGVTELFAALALRGPFYAIAGGEWLPTYALARSLRRKTFAIQDALGRVRLARPFTCYQMLDLLSDIRPERTPVIVLDFLHHFHNPDIPLDVRGRILQQCCKRLKYLSLLRPMLVFVQVIQTEEYRSFFPLVVDIADEVLQAAEAERATALQPALF